MKTRESLLIQRAQHRRTKIRSTLPINRDFLIRLFCWLIPIFMALGAFALINGSDTRRAKRDTLHQSAQSQRNLATHTHITTQDGRTHYTHTRLGLILTYDAALNCSVSPQENGLRITLFPKTETPYHILTYFTRTPSSQANLHESAVSYLTGTGHSGMMVSLFIKRLSMEPCGEGTLTIANKEATATALQGYVNGVMMRGCVATVTDGDWSLCSILLAHDDEHLNEALEAWADTLSTTSVLPGGDTHAAH